MVAPIHYDQNRLKSWIEEESADSSCEIARHVETCATCQSTMESLFQDGLSLEITGSLLREGLVAHPIKEVDVGSLALSDSSDHPNSLGRFSRYEVIEFLGRGGMGIVMRAFDPHLDRHCAVKVLAPELASSAAARKRFAREAKSAAAVVHPHVVPIQTVDEHSGLPYLVMPVVDGRSLQQRVESDGPLSVIEAVRIASQIAEGLAAAHAKGLVHRDIKPANILLENGVERVQITDFGLARAIDDATMTRSGVIAGTPQYMSPEQAHGDAIDHRSDLFSLGSVMYFMLSGRSPFRAETTMGVLNRIGNDQPRSLRSINADVPGWLEAIVMRLLAKPRDERFADASDVADLLEHWLNHLQNPEAPRPKVPSVPESEGVERENTASRVGNGGWSRWLVLAAAPLFAFFGVIIILETGKGTLRIETKSDTDVPIVIRQGEDVVEHLTVSREGTSTRLRAGEYIVQIDNADSDLIIANGEVVLKRGGQWTTRITESPRAADMTREHDYSVAVRDVPVHPLASKPNQSPLIGKWRLLRWLNADRDEATDVQSEITVITIDDSFVTSSTEGVYPDERYFYLLRHGNVLHLAETSEDLTGGTGAKLRYSFPEPGLLRFETLGSEGGVSGWGSEWQRADGTPEPKTAEASPSINPVPLTTSKTGGSADELDLTSEAIATTVQANQGNELRLAKKTNMSRLRVQKEAEFEPTLLIEWDVDEGISWLFSEPPIRREKLGSYPYAFNLGPNQNSQITMIDSKSRRIETRWWMECQDANDRFWESIRGKKIEIRVRDEDFRSVNEGSRVQMVIYLSESDGQYTDKLGTVTSTQEEDDVLRLAKKRGQPVISVLMAPINRGSFP
ncbi:MAG TPA: hypothetical protein DDW52_09530 [Planctomycetaceae bacterium]|nr:hypothetical protein [Planctomycetaceae bacterium]